MNSRHRAVAAFQNGAPEDIETLSGRAINFTASIVTSSLGKSHTEVLAGMATAMVLVSKQAGLSEAATIEGLRLAFRDVNGNLKLTEQEIEDARTKNGGWTKQTLAGWGVPWPPPHGWKAALISGEPIPSMKPGSLA